MLPKKNRISRKDFPSHNKQGLRVFSPFFSGTIYQNENKIKVSVVVSKKTAKTAVMRNYLRRVFYTSMGEYTKSPLKGALIVLCPKVDAGKASFLLLKLEIKKVLQLAKVLK